MPVPSSSVLVTAAAAPSTTNGSLTSQYFFGRSPPLGKGDLRVNGMWECSGTQSESKPRSSSARASSVGDIEWCVKNMAPPMRIVVSLVASLADQVAGDEFRVVIYRSW